MESAMLSKRRQLTGAFVATSILLALSIVADAKPAGGGKQSQASRLGGNKLSPLSKQAMVNERSANRSSKNATSRPKAKAQQARQRTQQASVGGNKHHDCSAGPLGGASGPSGLPPTGALSAKVNGLAGSGKTARC
jgi:hypothetical protein